MSDERPSGTRRALLLAALVLVLVLGGFGLFVWVSSSGDADLPFGYAGFD